MLIVTQSLSRGDAYHLTLPIEASWYPLGTAQTRDFWRFSKNAEQRGTRMRLIYWNYEQITPSGSTVRTVSSLSLSTPQ